MTLAIDLGVPKTMTLFSIVPPHLRREALGVYG
jgi:hypothetical protein